MEIKPGNFMISTEFWGRNLNLFLVQGGYLFLIDTGLAGMPGELVFPYVDDHGLSLETLTLFANTHAHADHMGGNAEIKAAQPKARLASHELDRPWIEDHELLCQELYRRHSELGLFRPEAEKQMLAVCGSNSPVDVAWRGGEIIDLDGRYVEVIHAPGHTPGNLVFFDRDAGILFEGETILGATSGEPGKLGVPYYYDVVAYRNTLHHLAALPWELLLSSHAEPREREAGEKAIQESLGFADQFHEQVTDVLSDQQRPIAFDQLVGALSERYGYALGLGLALLTDTHLDYLQRAKRAKQLPNGGWAV